MEIDITDFVREDDPAEYSGSIAERGRNAGPETWANALARAAVSPPMLATEDQLDAMRDWARDSGGWDDAEISAWSDEDLNALFIQLVSGDMRAMGLDECDPDEFDWEAWRERSDGGNSIFRGDVGGSPGFGRIFYYLGS